MGKLIYSMVTSLDGYTSDPHGDFGWGVTDSEAHAFVNEQARSIGTYLYGRRMYETMLFWETAHTEPDQPQFVLDYARTWQAATKIVYSTTLSDVDSARTSLQRTFDPAAVRALKAQSSHDLTVDGPHLAAQAVRAGLVDEFQLYVGPAIVGGGTRFFPDGVRADLHLLDELRISKRLVYLRYGVEGDGSSRGDEAEAERVTGEVSEDV